MMRANGFTLIELLVAMTAGALLLASLSWAISRLGRDLAATKRALPTSERLALSDRLHLLLAGARGGPNDRVELSDKKLSFTTNAPLSAGPVGLVTAELEVTGRAGSQALILSLRDSGGRALGTSEHSELLSDQRKIWFGWIGNAPNGAIRASAISLRMIDQAGEETELAFPLHINGDPTCQFDPISMVCR